MGRHGEPKQGNREGGAGSTERNGHQQGGNSIDWGPPGSNRHGPRAIPLGPVPARCPAPHGLGPGRGTGPREPGRPQLGRHPTWALALLPRITPGLDLGRVLAMATLHDGPECLSGDLPRVAARALPAGAKAQMEVLARELLEPLGPVAHAAWQEFAAQETREARFVKGCDRVQLALEVLRLARAGLGDLGPFVQGLDPGQTFEFEPLTVLWRQILAELHPA
ncbi:MAG: HD domain-containing protein [Planctomycetota bacterium]